LNGVGAVTIYGVIPESGKFVSHAFDNNGLTYTLARPVELVRAHTWVRFPGSLLAHHSGWVPASKPAIVWRNMNNQN
jgi:hypothetical protein